MVYSSGLLRPVEMFSDLASLWSLHANALESCREIIIVENAVDEAGVRRRFSHLVEMVYQ